MISLKWTVHIVTSTIFIYKLHASNLINLGKIEITTDRRQLLLILRFNACSEICWEYFRKIIVFNSFYEVGKSLKKIKIRRNELNWQFHKTKLKSLLPIKSETGNFGDRVKQGQIPFQKPHWCQKIPMNCFAFFLNIEILPLWVF